MLTIYKSWNRVSLYPAVSADADAAIDSNIGLGSAAAVKFKFYVKCWPNILLEGKMFITPLFVGKLFTRGRPDCLKLISFTLTKKFCEVLFRNK